MIQRIGVYGRETGLTEQLEGFCRGEQMEMIRVTSPETLQNMIREEKLHAVILDIALDEQGVGEGIQWIRSLRGLGGLPLLVISSQKSERAKIAALSMGADDYMTGDENPLVTKARLKSQLRRFIQLSEKDTEKSRVYSVDELRVDDTVRKVTVEGREVKLTPTEYQILKLLVKERGRVYSIPQIYEEIWKMNAVGVDNTIAVHVRHIREKIERNPRDPKYLKVIWGTGYKVG